MNTTEQKELMQLLKDNPLLDELLKMTIQSSRIEDTLKGQKIPSIIINEITQATLSLSNAYCEYRKYLKD